MNVLSAYDPPPYLDRQIFIDFRSRSNVSPSFHRKSRCLLYNGDHKFAFCSLNIFGKIITSREAINQNIKKIVFVNAVRIQRNIERGFICLKIENNYYIAIQTV